MSELPAKATPARSAVRRWLPLAAIVALSVAAIAIGWNRKISFETLVRHNEAVHAFILGSRITAVAIYVAVYVVAIALSLPGGLILTMSGGFLFGGLLGGAAAVIGATAGACIFFTIAKSAFGEHLARRAGPLAEKLAEGFRADAFHYLLFLRLVPVFPFVLINIVPALAGVRLRMTDTFNDRVALGFLVMLAWFVWAWPAVAATPHSAPADDGRLWRRLPVAVCATAILISPLLLAAWRLWRAGDYSSQTYVWRNAPGGIDIATLFLGNQLNLLTGGWTT